MVHYKDDLKRENYLEKHGAKRCPVCGHIAVQPGMLPNNGNGHVCLNCRAEYLHCGDCDEVFPLNHKNRPFKDKIFRSPIMLRTEPDRHSKAPYFSAIFLLVAMIYLAGCAVIVKAEYSALEVELISDPRFSDINDPVNLANATENDTVIGQWKEDLGNDMPNGTYYGTLFRPSTFEFTHLTPTWRQNGTVGEGEAGQYTYVMLSGHFNLSTQKIMSGASEWWMRVPVHPDSIEARFGLSINIFKNVDNASDVRIHGNYSCLSDSQSIRPRAAYNGYTPDVIVEYDSTAGSSGGKFSDYKHPLDMRIANGHVYVQASAVIEPSVDYVISVLFRLPRDQNLIVYFNTAERPAGGWTAIDTAEMRIHDAGGPNYYVEKLDSHLFELSLDLDWSFIFVEGVGAGGLFGKKISLPANYTLSVYPYFNTSRTGNQYMSFMLPWISDDTVNITPQVYTADGQQSWEFNNGDAYFAPEFEYQVSLLEDVSTNETVVELGSTEHLWIGKMVKIDDDDSPSVTNFITDISGDIVTLLYEFEHNYTTGQNAHLWMMVNMGWNYSDYCLFSTNDTLNWATFDSDDCWNVELEFLFNDPITMTLLCYYEENRPTYLWSEVNMSNTSRNPYFYPFSWGWPGNSEFSETYKLHYNVYCSARGTDGQWTIINTTSSGRETYTHYFPQRIHLSSATWYIENGTKKERYDFDSDAAYFWYMAGEEWKQGPGHYLKGISYGVKSVFYGIWEGGDRLVGRISDFLSDAWEGFKRIGQWIITAVAEFIGRVIDFFETAYDTIVTFWGSAQYLVAPVLMMAIVAVGGKLSTGMMKGRGDT